MIVNPSFVLGPDDPNPSGTSNALVRRLLLRRIPGYLDGAINIVDVRDVARGHLLADERGEDGERYLLTGRNFTLQRLFADLSRIAGVPPPPLRMQGRLAVAGVEAMELVGLRLPTSADEVRSGTQWFTYRNDKAREKLGWEPRPHEETLEDTVRWQLEELGKRAEGHRLTDLALRTHRRRPAHASLHLMSEPRRVLYRCGTPTNFLCPCGAVARQAQQAGARIPDRARPLPAREPRPRSSSSPACRTSRCWSTGTRSSTTRAGSCQYLDWKYGEEEQQPGADSSAAS